MAKKPCSVCGQMRYVGRDSRPEPTCQDCRRSMRLNETKPCLHCGEQITGQGRSYCSRKCANSREYRPKRAIGDRRRTRYERDRAAPGMTGHQRKLMLRQVKRAGAACAYCNQRAATTIDHVIPLARGGTNYEGNLVPCCKACNSSKADRLLIEWRLGRPASATFDPRPWLLTGPPPPTRVVRPKPVKAERVADCCICGARFTARSHRNVTCGPRCSDERAARQSREMYRAKVGLPPTWHVPTMPHVRRSAHQGRPVS